MLGSERAFTRRFGTVAVRRGWITTEQFLEAMTLQVQEDLAGRPHRLIGTILLGLGYLTPNQIEQIVIQTLADGRADGHPPDGATPSPGRVSGTGASRGGR